MKTRVFPALLLSAACFCCAQARAVETRTLKSVSKGLAAELRTRMEKTGKFSLAVMDFPYYDGSVSLGSARISESLTVNLAKEGVAVLERKLVYKLLEEKKAQLSGLFDERSAAEFGKLLGAGAILTGTMEDLDDGRARINLRVIDTATGVLLTGDEVFIKRDWEKHGAREKAPGQGKVSVEINFEPEQAGRIDAPELRIEESGLDFSGVDIDKLEKYDAAVKFEKASPDYAAISETWTKLAAELPDYGEIALERARRWKKYSEEVKEYELARQRRRLAMAKDYGRLSRLLKLDVVPPAKKDEFAQKFIDAYGPDNGYSDAVEKYLVSPCLAGPKLGYCYYDGSTAIEGKYEAAWNFREGLATVWTNGKAGYVDKSGKEVIPAKFEYSSHFSEGLAETSSGGKYGFIDKRGKTVIPFKFPLVSDFREGLAAVFLYGKYGFMDTSGKVVVQPKYEHSGFIFRHSFSEGLADVCINGKCGYIDKAGREVIPLIYEAAGGFNEGLASVKLNGKYGCIDKAGKEKIPFMYDSVLYFNDDLSPAGIDGKYGFIDRTGKEVLPPAYEDADSFYDGLAAVKLNGKYGYIDKAGKVVIPFKYDRASGFRAGVAAVQLPEGGGYIDKTGKALTPFKYESMYSPFDSTSVAGRKCLVDRWGREYFPEK